MFHFFLPSAPNRKRGYDTINKAIFVAMIGALSSDATCSRQQKSLRHISATEAQYL